MSEKIKAGKVKGVNDPQKAQSLVIQGDVTYTQAQNIAKAGNIDSIIFDMKEQSVVSLGAFGISFAVSFANCKWNGLDTKQSLRISCVNALESGFLVMGTGVLARQFLKTTIGRNFAAYSTKSIKSVINQVYKTNMGKNAIHRLASSIAGKPLSGAAAKNVVTKVARTEWPVVAFLTVASSMPDLYSAAISKEISWTQFSKNISVNIASTLGGIGGAAAGGVVGSLVFPGVGTFIGTIIGGFGVGGGSNFAAKWVANLICEDDSVQMNRIIENVTPLIASDYLVTKDEFEQIINEVQSTTNAKWLRKMYKAGVKGKSIQDKALFRSEYTYLNLSPIFERCIAKREKVYLPAESKIRHYIWKIRISFFISQIIETVKSYFGGNRKLISQEINS